MSQSEETLTGLLRANAATRGAAVAVLEKARGVWRRTTWRGYAEDAAALAAALAADGVARGTAVAVVSDNRPRLYAAMAAAHWLGAIVVPLFPDASADELEDPLRRSEATHVFAENQEQVDKLLDLLPRCPAIRRIVFDRDRGMRHYGQPELARYDALIGEGRALLGERRAFLDAEAGRGRAGDAAFLFFTPGTAGASRGVVHSHAALIDRARALTEADGIAAGDTTVAYLQPAWLGQTLFAYVLPLVAGSCVACPESSDTLVADMREVGPTVLLATPRVLEALLTQVALRMEEAGAPLRRIHRLGVARATAPGRSTPSGGRFASGAFDLLIRGPLRDALGLARVRAAYAAGDALAPDLLGFYRRLGVPLRPLYGSTETGLVVAMPAGGRASADTVGTAARGVELRLSPQGEILVRSPGLLVEYHRDAEATARARTADGWFRTGDLGELGPDGTLTVVDRLEHVGALAGGTPFVPRPIENRLRCVPYIDEVVVFGDGRDMVSALVDIDAGAVGAWADRHGISHSGHADLAANEAVYGLIAGCIAEANAELAADPRRKALAIRRFALLPGTLSAEEGLVTRTGKLRRHAIAERYGALVAAMVDGGAALGEGEGEGDGGAAVLRIGDVGRPAPMPAGRAA